MEHENGLVAGDGNEYKPIEVFSPPSLDWPSMDPNKYYVIYMGCPDGPEVANPVWREVVHWFVVNVPGNQVDKGDVLCTYLGPFPPNNGDMFRYVYLVYEQPNKMDFNEKVMNSTNVEDIKHFKIAKFSEKYKLGQPLAGNVYRSQWDESVAMLHKKIGFVIDE